MKKNIELMEQFFFITRLLHRSHHHQNKINNKESFRGQGKVLLMIHQHAGISQRDLSQILAVRSQSLGETLLKLEHNGFVIRKANEKDKRVMNVFLTPEGETAAKFMGESMQKSSEIFDCLTDEEKENLSRYMLKIAAELEKTAWCQHDADN